MKKILFIGILLLGITIANNAQDIKVLRSYRLFEQKGFHPKFNSDGSMLAFSSPSYKGLDVYKLSDKSIVRITEEDGAGFEPIFSNDNKKIFYKKTSYDQRLQKESIESYSFSNKAQEQVVRPRRNLMNPQVHQNGLIVVADNQMIKSDQVRKDSAKTNYVWSDGRNLNIYRNDKAQTINPIEGSNGYIWASLSPNSKMILFTAVGRGTFVCNLDGEVIASLGYLNAPIWYTDELVLGMKDKDNGEIITESKIVIKNLSGNLEKELTQSGVIALYPTAAPAVSKIAYNTDKGDIHVIELSVTK